MTCFICGEHGHLKNGCLKPNIPHGESQHVEPNEESQHQESRPSTNDAPWAAEPKTSTSGTSRVEEHADTSHNQPWKTNAEVKESQVDDEGFVTVHSQRNKRPNINGHDVIVSVSKKLAPSSKLRGSYVDTASSLAALETENKFAVLAPVDVDSAPDHVQDEHEHEQHEPKTIYSPAYDDISKSCGWIWQNLVDALGRWQEQAH